MLKVKATDDGDCDIPSKKSRLQPGLSQTVVSHYNGIPEKGLSERNKSRIVYMRNFNNWIKSMIIGEYVEKCAVNSDNLNVLDMCCGKGGDLLKWNNKNVKHLICADIADISIDQCRTRYHSRTFNFSAEFIVADCTKQRLKDCFDDNSIMLDIVSCQFSFHYCFESLQQTERMLRNASDSLKPGGYFIGTIPDANEIVARQRKAGSLLFGNDVYKIQFQCDSKNIPLFGAKYDFYLEGVVNCPEFLVYFPVLIKLAEKYDLELVHKMKFPDFYEKYKDSGRDLLRIIKVFETYPPRNEITLQGNSEEYKHADEYLSDHSNVRHIGTMSSMEWETASLYTTFAFQKKATAKL